MQQSSITFMQVDLLSHDVIMISSFLVYAIHYWKVKQCLKYSPFSAKLYCVYILSTL